MYVLWRKLSQMLYVRTIVHSIFLTRMLYICTLAKSENWTKYLAEPAAATHLAPPAGQDIQKCIKRYFLRYFEMY